MYNVIMYKCKVPYHILGEDVTHDQKCVIMCVTVVCIYTWSHYVIMCVIMYNIRQGFAVWKRPFWCYTFFWCHTSCICNVLFLWCHMLYFSDVTHYTYITWYQKCQLGRHINRKRQPYISDVTHDTHTTYQYIIYIYSKVELTYIIYMICIMS